MAGTFKVGVCDCWTPASMCCGSFWCPCIFYGNTQQLRENPSAQPSNFSGPCCLWCGICAFTGAQCILQFLNRQDMRKQYNIAGSAGKDFCISWCCANCALVQERKEVEYQNSRKGGAPGVPGGVGSGGVTAQPAPQQGMQYTSPPPQNGQQHYGAPPPNVHQQPPQGYAPPAQPGMAYGEPGKMQ